MQITYKKAFELVNILNKIDIDVKDKLSWDIIEFVEKLKPIIADFNKKSEKINRQFCAIDDRGLILYDDKGDFKYTPEQDQLRSDAIENLFNLTTVIEKHICQDFTRLKTFNLVTIHALKGYLFNVSEEEFKLLILQ